MPVLPLVFTLVVAVMLACAGWFLIFRTRMMIPPQGRTPEQAASLHKGSYAELANKSWFPLLLRGQGIVCWLGALFLLGVAASVVIFR